MADTEPRITIRLRPRVDVTAVRGLVETVRGMCTDEIPHVAIDQALGEILDLLDGYPESTTPERFPDIVKRLAAAQSRSVSSVSYEAYTPGLRGTNPDTFKSVMAGRRRPTIALMRATAAALQVSPNVFAEYRLLNALDRLDARS